MRASAPLRVLFVASECYPLVKTGGLADVIGALPLALATRACEVRVLLPAYLAVRRRLPDAVPEGVVADLFGGGARLLRARTDQGLEVLALDAPHLFGRPGNPYAGPDGHDWLDNPLRFAALSWVASRIALGGLGRWVPDVVHAHDWQAGLVPAYLAFASGSRPPTVMTVHNLAFAGLFDPALLGLLRLPVSSFTPAGLEFFGRISFLKAGLAYADRLTTVSPTYASEIGTEEHGMGLHGVLRERAHLLSGIVNGIDTAIWDPAGDPHIARRYDGRHLAAKAVNKEMLQRAFDLDVRAEAPLFCVISRLTAQKGLDLLLAVLPTLLEAGGQLVVLGSGEPALEAGLREAAAAAPGRIGVEIGYDEPLAHRIQAGADAIIVPSRFEPCGLTQLCGLRYGTLPVVSRVGGLADTVIDANEAALRAGVATGFQFVPVTAAALGFAIARACALFAHQPRWQAMQRRAMASKVGWSVAARAYRRLYDELTAASDTGRSSTARSHPS